MVKVDHPNLKRQYRMPRVFGAMPGPRNVPADKQDLPNNQTNLEIDLWALTDADLLAELLPPDCELAGEPQLQISMRFMSNIGWLGGHGYSIVSVGFPITYKSPTRGDLTGSFTPVLWENLADPIVTGREELGFAKIYAEMPPPLIVGDTYSGSASWQGFRFFEIRAHDLAEVSTEPKPRPGSFHYKYVPKTGSLGEPDVEYLEFSPPDELATGYGNMSVDWRKEGKGEFAFYPARWEDVPFQYPIINALAALPIVECRDASVTRLVATGTIGDPSAGALKAID